MDIYMLLFLLSPIINKALLAMNNREYKVGLVILLAINVCWGWIKGDGINPSGYTISQFCMMYYIGYGCRLLMESDKDKRQLRKIAFYVLISSLCVTIFITVLLSRLGSTNKLFDYNNPLIIICSICIFLIFAFSKPFKNKGINFIASSMLPVYLVHEQGGFAEWYMKIIADCYINNYCCPIKIGIS